MPTKANQLNIAATNPAHGLAFTYPWVGHYSIQNKTHV